MHSRERQNDEREDAKAAAHDDDAGGLRTAEEERGILEAISSVDAGNGLSFEDVFRELEDFGE